jgi:hypothetical protein
MQISLVENIVMFVIQVYDNIAPIEANISNKVMRPSLVVIVSDASTKCRLASHCSSSSRSRNNYCILHRAVAVMHSRGSRGFPHPNRLQAPRTELLPIAELLAVAAASRALCRLLHTSRISPLTSRSRRICRGPWRRRCWRFLRRYQSSNGARKPVGRLHDHR